MNTREIARRILIQRTERYTDPGPPLGQVGSARFRLDSARLRVAYASAYPGMARELVLAIARFARSRRMQVQWTVVPELPGEADLASALLAEGFTMTENLLLMAHEGPITASLNPRVSVQPITTWQAMWFYEFGSRRSFYGDPHPSDPLVGQRARERWREQEQGWCRYIAAFIDGNQIGGCYASLYEDIPTIMGVYTLPEYRGRGVATALLAHVVVAVTRPDNLTVCLYVEHGNPAEHLYRQLGFVPLLDTQTYVRNYS